MHAPKYTGPGPLLLALISRAGRGMSRVSVDSFFVFVFNCAPLDYDICLYLAARVSLSLSLSCKPIACELYTGIDNAATTGAKRVILIIDRSGSMDRDYPTRMDVAQEAATSVIETLTNADYFGIVSFSSSAQVYSSKLQVSP